ncbi:MAG: NUDIX hydrolase [Planktothrix sp. GU0601_MAG3]|nr:MAG: NUDIX hydrolase [Planktothrix sp. GU0601_MAG3]
MWLLCVSDNRFLLIQEVTRNSPWYFPGGRVEADETFAAAAQRETLEEAGIPVILEGILRIQHLPHPTEKSRLGVFFLARPEGNTQPKSQPDQESLGAKWFTLKELEELPLRSEFVKTIISEVLTQVEIYPLQLIIPQN